MNQTTQPDGPASTSTIVEALDKNKDATEEVKRVADDLLVVHAVLKEETTQSQPDLVERAIEQAAEGSEASGGNSDRSPPAQQSASH